MIGMNQIKKKTFQGIAIGLGIGVVGIGLTVWWALSTIQSYENWTNAKFKAKFTQNVTVLTKDVIQGELIKEDMLTTVSIHNKTVPTNVAGGSISGKVAKYNISANVPLTNSMLTEEIIASDVRIQEVNTVVIPSDLVEGDKIDIRIMFPNGTDYIVLAQKAANKIVGQTIWVQLSEDERLYLSSAMVDTFLRPGTKLYATKYADPDAQIKISEDSAEKAKGYVQEEIKKEASKIQSASETELTTMIFDLVSKYKNFSTTVARTQENYQPNTQVIEMMQANKNILPLAIEKLSQEARRNIENGIESYKSESGENYTNVVTGATQSITEQKALREELISGALAQTQVNK